LASLSPDNLHTCTVKLSIDDTHGTGFFVAAGLILTCHHVVKNAGDRPIKVRWQNQENFAEAKVLQSFPDPVDLALLQFKLQFVTGETLGSVKLCPFSYFLN
jgi:S1-C subfamily serine protease